MDPTEPQPIDLTLRTGERLGVGPWEVDAEMAAIAGWIDIEAAEPYQVLATIDHQRRTFLLLAAPGGRPEYAGLGRGEERFALWLIRVGHRVVDGEEEMRREAGVRLYDRFVASDSYSDASCDVPSSLRARDLDGDGEVELTVLAAGADEPYEYAYCGVVAFLVGGDDLAVQARFSRQHYVEITGAGGDWTMHDDTTWIVRDVNGDGHADLHVVQRWSARDFFMGDWVGDGTMPGEHRRGSDRREIDCLYDLPSDSWRCPTVEGYVLGSRLFFTPADVADPRGAERVFRDPPWPGPLRDAPMP